MPLVPPEIVIAPPAGKLTVCEVPLESMLALLEEPPPLPPAMDKVPPPFTEICWEELAWKASIKATL